jgi:hypothetical protein
MYHSGPIEDPDGAASALNQAALLQRSRHLRDRGSLRTKHLLDEFLR